MESSIDRALLSAVADRIFPAGEGVPAASELGAVDYVLGQLAGGWGEGDRMYAAAPYVAPTHEGHGWQSPARPGDVLAATLRMLDESARSRHGASFERLDGREQDELLRALERGESPAAHGIDSSTQFALLRDAVVEGVFADPRHGGNRDGAAWRWLGYPGPPAIEAP